MSAQPYRWGHLSGVLKMLFCPARTDLRERCWFIFARGAVPSTARYSSLPEHKREREEREASEERDTSKQTNNQKTNKQTNKRTNERTNKRTNKQTNDDTRHVPNIRKCGELFEF